MHARIQYFPFECVKYRCPKTYRIQDMALSSGFASIQNGGGCPTSNNGPLIHALFPEHIQLVKLPTGERPALESTSIRYLKSSLPGLYHLCFLYFFFCAAKSCGSRA